MRSALDKLRVLTTTNFGQRVAEEETGELAAYFVETDHWRRVYSGDVDIVYGPKGSGKSAIYSLLVSKTDHLFDRSIVLVPAENPRGAPAFKDLVADPPTSEPEFIGLWKLYFACLLVGVLEEYGIQGEATTQLRGALAREGLMPQGRDLKGVLASALLYVRSALRPAGVEAGIQIDPVTSLPRGFTGRITFREPTPDALKDGFTSVDRLLSLADEAFRDAGLTAWLLLDRLDVAFAESDDLEQNALRAVFKVYLDMFANSAIRVKIFLRSDIWRRITAGGFREASHITRHLTITWDRRTLLNLVVRRAIQNTSIQEYYGATPDAVLSTQLDQEAFFDRMFPEQVDVGPKQPTTFDWMLGRTQDGTKQTAPRELIHLLNALRDVQVRRIEAGDPVPDGDPLFSRPAFKEALIEVSRARVEQTLFAEYPRLRPFLVRLRGQKTRQTPETVATLWDRSPEEAAAIADDLAEAGFFEIRGTRAAPEYWVPFIFRDALDLVQGTAEVE